jgi:ABC-type glycerol-3-phosphate transport system substrate-binding protein
MVRNRMRKFALAVLTALALTAGAVAASSNATLAGDPSQWGIDSLAKKGSFDITSSNGGEMARKVNEYEGQHRVA